MSVMKVWSSPPPTAAEPVSAAPLCDWPQPSPHSGNTIGLLCFLEKAANQLSPYGPALDVGELCLGPRIALPLDVEDVEPDVVHVRVTGIERGEVADALVTACRVPLEGEMCTGYRSHRLDDLAPIGDELARVPLGPPGEPDSVELPSQSDDGAPLASSHHGAGQGRVVLVVGAGRPGRQGRAGLRQHRDTPDHGVALPVPRGEDALGPLDRRPTRPGKEVHRVRHGPPGPFGEGLRAGDVSRTRVHARARSRRRPAWRGTSTPGWRSDPGAQRLLPRSRTRRTGLRRRRSRRARPTTSACVVDCVASFAFPPPQGSSSLYELPVARPRHPRGRPGRRLATQGRTRHSGPGPPWLSGLPPAPPALPIGATMKTACRGTTGPQFPGSSGSVLPRTPRKEAAVRRARWALPRLRSPEPPAATRRDPRPSAATRNRTDEAPPSPPPTPRRTGFPGGNQRVAARDGASSHRWCDDPDDPGSRVRRTCHTVGFRPPTIGAVPSRVGLHLSWTGIATCRNG